MRLPAQDNAPDGVQINGFPGGVGRWSPVAAAKLRKPPYNRICQVTGVGGGSSGTGWLHSQGSVLTAAHVVAGAASVRLRFAGQEAWIPAQIGKITDGYFGPGGEERPCSPADMARIIAPTGLGIATNAFASIAGGLFAAVGFQDGVLVEHVGNGADVGPFLAHNCDTDHEHSGCPVFASAGVHAIHVGLFAGSRAYLDPPKSQTQGFLNSAVRLNAAFNAALDTTHGEQPE